MLRFNRLKFKQPEESYLPPRQMQTQNSNPTEKKKKKKRYYNFKDKLKTELCRYFFTKKGCEYGDQCSFAHDKS